MPPESWTGNMDIEQPPKTAQEILELSADIIARGARGEFSLEEGTEP